MSPAEKEYAVKVVLSDTNKAGSKTKIYSFMILVKLPKVEAKPESEYSNSTNKTAADGATNNQTNTGGTGAEGGNSASEVEENSSSSSGPKKGKGSSKNR